MNSLSGQDRTGAAGGGTADLQNGRRPDLHLAAVVSADGIRFAAADVSRDAVLTRIAAYVQEHAGTMLWPRDAKRVSRLLEMGSLEAAIETYFGGVGKRWDREQLHHTVLTFEQQP